MKMIPKNKTILVIDNDLPNRELMLFLLRDKAHLIFVNSTIEDVKAIRLKPDLILLEFYTGKCDFEFIKAVKCLMKQTPIVALTACAMSDEREKSLNYGCDYYLSKPLNIKELLKLCSRLLAG